MLQVRKTYSGKQGGCNDDMVIAFQLAMIAMRTFYSSPKYERFQD